MIAHIILFHSQLRILRACAVRCCMANFHIVLRGALGAQNVRSPLLCHCSRYTWIRFRPQLCSLRTWPQFVLAGWGLILPSWPVRFPLCQDRLAPLGLLYDVFRLTAVFWPRFHPSPILEPAVRVTDCLIAIVTVRYHTTSMPAAVVYALTLSFQPLAV